MKAAIASSNAFFDSAEVSLARYPREGAIVRARRRISRRALLQIEDRASGALEVSLRVLLGSSLLVALVECVWQLAQY